MASTGQHFFWWDLLHNETLTQNYHIVGAGVAFGILGVAGAVYSLKTPRLTKDTKEDKLFVPEAKFSVRNVFEFLAEVVLGIAKDIIGHGYHKYLPLLIFIFLWTLVNNLMGMIPGLPSPTDNLNTTLAMGLVTFIYYNYQGFKSNGLNYLQHFTGHLPWTLFPIIPLMFVIEIISHSVRPITLGLRLRSNISGDHTVYGIVLGLFQSLASGLESALGPVGTAIGHVFAVIGPVPIVVLGILVCVIQAFVFTLLTTIYVGIATAHDDH